jgi:hypothetical protein
MPYAVRDESGNLIATGLNSYATAIKAVRRYLASHNDAPGVTIYDDDGEKPLRVNHEMRPVELVRPDFSGTCNSTAQVEKAIRQYKHAVYSTTQEILVLVGHAAEDTRHIPPREPRWDDPPWESPDGLAPYLVLDSDSYDCWYWHPGSGALLRPIDTLHPGHQRHRRTRRVVVS